MPVNWFNLESEEGGHCVNSVVVRPVYAKKLIANNHYFYLNKTRMHSYQNLRTLELCLQDQIWIQIGRNVRA